MTVPVTELKRGDSIPVTKPVQLPEANLPLDPYILGLWLADGKHTDGSITIGQNDLEEISVEISNRRYELSNPWVNNAGRGAKPYSGTILNIRGKLDEIGVRGNKHIPAPYLRASIEQRIELLRGLMDGDGSANDFRKQAVFINTNRTLIHQVHELACSLGQRATIVYYKAKGFGKMTDAWRVCFRPQYFNPFSLPRKAKKMRWKTWGPGKSNRRVVKQIEKIESTPTQCIAVDSPCRTYLAGEQFCVTHNTGRKFGNEVKHSGQAYTYAVSAFMRYPELEFVKAEFWYLDQGETLERKWTRAEAMLLLNRLTERAIKMTSATKSPAKPSDTACKWCHYGKNGDCGYGGMPV